MIAVIPPLSSFPGESGEPLPPRPDAEPYLPVKEKKERELARPKAPEKAPEADTANSAARLMRKHLRRERS